MTRRLAALDIGSNTLHLLVAEPRADGLHEVVHEVVMPRIGKVVQATGCIGEEKLAEVTAEVGRLASLARDAGAELLLLGATEAMRRAGDREVALAAVSAAAGADCVLIAPDAEARLSFRGAVGAHAGHGLALVADIGGGSTECVLGEPGAISALASIPVGSGAATERWLPSDPPTAAERVACADGVRALLATAPGGRPARGIVTGGTATTLPALLGRPQGSAAGSLDAADLDTCRAILGAAPSAAVAARFAIDPARARVLAGGVEIVAAVMARYGLERMAVSHQGLRDGMLLAYLEKGDRWAEG